MDDQHVHKVHRLFRPKVDLVKARPADGHGPHMHARRRPEVKPRPIRRAAPARLSQDGDL